MKDFDSWNQYKQNIDKKHKLPFFNEREIWWCSIGINVGSEILGKGNNFTRPVLIIKKYSYIAFLGVPMTTKTEKMNNFTYPIDCKNKPSLLLLSQMRTFNAKRLYRKIERINDNEFDDIKQKIIKNTF
jgi:mRNA interferase MazF